MPLQAVIITAGEGVRLRPLTVSRVKGMIPIANKPILEYVVNALSNNNIRDIVMVVGYKKERIMAYFEDGKEFDVDITYVEQKKQLGTAHALMQAKEHIKSDFLALPGDNIISSEAIARLLESNKADAAILVTDNETPSKYGIVGMSGNRIMKIIEKPKLTGDLLTKGVPSIFSLALWEYQEKTLSNIISTGIHKFNPKVFNYINNIMDNQQYSLTDLVQHMITKNLNIKGIKTESWSDAVYPWDLLEMNALALQNISNAKSGRIEHGAIIRPPVTIGSGTVLRSNSYIMGPVVIGSGCEIGPNTCILPSTSIGNNVRIDPFTEIKNTIIMDDCRIGSSSTIYNSVVSSGSRIGSHFISESSAPEVKLRAGMYQPKELGSIIGDDAEIGHSVILTSGIIVGANCKIASMNKVTENIPNGSVLV